MTYPRITLPDHIVLTPDLAAEFGSTWAIRHPAEGNLVALLANLADMNADDDHYVAAINAWQLTRTNTGHPAPRPHLTVITTAELEHQVDSIGPDQDQWTCTCGHTGHGRDDWHAHLPTSLAQEP